MRQALHIFRKDARYLRYETTLVLIFAVAFAAMHLRGPRGMLDEAWLPEMFLFIGLASIIGRAVLAESIPGDRQFWITRPYRWKSLVGAKLLFILVFVNLPILLAHALILRIDGFSLVSNLSGLLWSQVLLFAFSLPFAAFATLSSVKPFHVILFAFLVFVWLLTTAKAGGGLGGVAWVPNSIALLVLFATALTILFVQYKSRRTILSRYLAFGGIALSAMVVAGMPGPLVLKLQSSLSKDPAIGSSIHVALGHHPQDTMWTASLEPKVTLHVPIAVDGISSSTEIQPDALSLSFRGSDGAISRIGVIDCSNLKRGTISPSAVTVTAVCLADPAFFRQHHGHPVTLDASLYFTVFGNPRSQTMPLTDQPANAPDGLQCYTQKVKAEWDVYCRSAFRWPARLVYAKLGHTDANSFTQFISYSPFPANLNLDPIETRWASAYAAGPSPIVRDVTIVAEEPLAHLRRDFEAQGVQLNEFAYPSSNILPVSAIP